MIGRDSGIDPSQLFIALSYNPESGEYISYDTSINQSSSTGTITVDYLTSQAYWATYGLTKVFNQVDGVSVVKMELHGKVDSSRLFKRAFGDDLDPSFPPEEIIREISYIQVIDPSEHSIVHSFAPPLIMTAQYTQGDLDRAGNDPYQLKISIYDHEYTLNNYDTFIHTNWWTGTIYIEYWTSHAFAAKKVEECTVL